MSSFADFESKTCRLAPRIAVVLGSGLGSIVGRVRITADVGFAVVPGFVAPTVHGHSGRILAGSWDDVPVLVFQGRMHYYEGHPWDRVTAAVSLAANLGVKTLVLTNAAGGIRNDLNPGDLMLIRNHLTLLDRDAWRLCAAAGADRDIELSDVYSSRLVTRLINSESASGRTLPVGTYAALTGPSYETPAEIRALAAMGADAVGMSTAHEAAAGHEQGLEVVGISCITNKAAGLCHGPLDHREVLQTAQAPAERLANLIEKLVVEP